MTYAATSDPQSFVRELIAARHITNAGTDTIADMISLYNRMHKRSQVMLTRASAIKDRRQGAVHLVAVKTAAMKQTVPAANNTRNGEDIEALVVKFYNEMLVMEKLLAEIAENTKPKNPYMPIVIPTGEK